MNPNSHIYSKYYKDKISTPIITWAVINFTANQRFELKFLSMNSEWRQGVWLCASDGIEMYDERYKSVNLWLDNSPPSVVFRPYSEFGVFHFYNIWENENGRGSQSHSSGMLMEEQSETMIFNCKDIDTESNLEFSKLRFSITPLDS